MTTSSTPTVAPPTRSNSPLHAQSRRPWQHLTGPTAALLVTALVVSGAAYAAQNSPDPVAAAYDEFAISDAADVTTPPLPAVGPSTIPLADAATQATIDRLTADTADKASPGQLTLLSRLLLQRAAVTGDADTYSRATQALDRAVELAPSDLDVRAQRATARLTVHDFPGAARDTGLVLAARPDDLGALGASYDAAYETGDYTVAEAQLDRLVLLAPTAPQVLVRQARWAALNGSPTTAANLVARARVAADSSGAVGTARATYDLVAGKLALDEGRYGAALGDYEAALVAAPGWHVALAGLGRARAASGDLVGAEQAFAQAADAVPLPDTLSALGDVRTALGNLRGAADAYGTVDVVAQLDAVQQLFNRSVVLSRADRGVDTAAAVAEARSELRVRRDVYGYDALGWALLADGQVEAAAKAADRSLALGTLDPRMLAHAGLVRAAAGDESQARLLLAQAIDLSPTVDPLLMARVRTALAQLTSGATR